MKRIPVDFNMTDADHFIAVTDNPPEAGEAFIAHDVEDHEMLAIACQVDGTLTHYEELSYQALRHNQATRILYNGNQISSPTAFEDAVAQAGPGDTFRFVRDTTGPLVFRGQPDAPDSPTQTTAPIVITSDPGVWIGPGEDDA